MTGSSVVSSWMMSATSVTADTIASSDDGGRREPVVLLSLVEHDLQRADADDEHADAPVVDLLRFAPQVRRIEDEQLRHDDRRDADRQVDVEHPAPAVAVGQPAAEHRAEDRRDDDAEAPEAHRLAALVGRERFEQNRLRQRLQRAAGRALHDAERRSATARFGAMPQRNDDDVKPVTDIISSRLRPKVAASQPVIGRMMALATR